ncbi:DUF7668 domain-containing protein [Pseudomonas sp. EA_35y_Pfl2_R5]|uniref:DUF7668 domain-containing protein n=1 Tax=Pseudomonas sp. EA_35y_Pfl2_R5 TaxID=3088690 RepID=UPI0030DCAD79
MASNESSTEVPAIKDAESERPIPTAWRNIIKSIVSSFVRHDYHLTTSIPGVVPVQPDTAEQIENYIKGYGAELTELPEETWNSSICIWMGNRWDVLIDLWSRSEGRSDLALSLHVSEKNNGFEFNIYMVYVP